MYVSAWVQTQRQFCLQNIRKLIPGSRMKGMQIVLNMCVQSAIIPCNPQQVQQWEQAALFSHVHAQQMCSWLSHARPHS